MGATHGQEPELGWLDKLDSGSAESFDTGALVKLEGTGDGHPFGSSFIGPTDGQAPATTEATVLKANARRRATPSGSAAGALDIELTRGIAVRRPLSARQVKEKEWD